MRLANDLDHWFDHQFHLPSRTIYLGDAEDGIDHTTAATFIKAMHLLNATVSPVTILLNSTGGCWHSACAIYDAIQNSPCHVSIQVLGSAMSAGAVILQAADERIAHPLATVLLHDGYETRENDTPRTFEAWGAESKRNRQTMYRIFAERSGRSPKYWERKCASDCILNAKEAVAEGLVDRIMTQ